MEGEGVIGAKAHWLIIKAHIEIIINKGKRGKPK
jgi:hypothetical protein